MSSNNFVSKLAKAWVGVTVLSLTMAVIIIAAIAIWLLGWKILMMILGSPMSLMIFAIFIYATFFQDRECEDE